MNEIKKSIDCPYCKNVVYVIFKYQLETKELDVFKLFSDKRGENNVNG